MGNKSILDIFHQMEHLKRDKSNLHKLHNLVASGTHVCINLSYQTHIFIGSHIVIYGKQMFVSLVWSKETFVFVRMLAILCAADLEITLCSHQRGVVYCSHYLSFDTWKKTSKFRTSCQLTREQETTLANARSNTAMLWNGYIKLSKCLVSVAALVLALKQGVACSGFWNFLFWKSIDLHCIVFTFYLCWYSCPLNLVHLWKQPFTDLDSRAFMYLYNLKYCRPIILVENHYVIIGNTLNEVLVQLETYSFY